MVNSDILGAVTTPLALAALCLLLGTAFMKVVAGSKSTQAVKLAIHWGFVLALTMAVLANISYLTVASFGREIRIAGTIRDDSGQPLGRAIVESPGHGRGITDDYGAFEFSIPDSRKSESYEIVASLEGYSTESMVLEGPKPKRTVSLTLKKPVLLANDLIRRPSMVIVSHYLGMPQVDIGLSFANPVPSEVLLENISLTLVAPDGKRISLPMACTYDPLNNQPSPALPSVLLEKSGTWNLNYGFFLGDMSLNDLMQKAQVEFPANSAIPAPGTKIFSPGLVDEFKGYMRRHMIWTAGTWQLIIACDVGSESMSRTSSFSLTDTDIQRMEAVANYYETGAGVLPIARLPQFADASASVVVTILE